MTRILFFFSLFLFFGCDSSKLSKTPENQFIGKWKLTNRSMLEGIEVQIQKDENQKLSGIITKLNDNKYVNLFCELGDQFISSVKRTSNYQFQITEKRIAAPLFSIYGQETSQIVDVEFVNKNKIKLGTNGSNGILIRIQ